MQEFTIEDVCARLDALQSVCYSQGVVLCVCLGIIVALLLSGRK